MNRFLLCLCTIFLCASCSIQDSDVFSLEVGQEFVDSNIRVVVLDTFELEMTTFKFDSINTSDSNRLLFGRYADDYFGTIEARPFFELVAPVAETTVGGYDIDTEAEFDSIALVLGYDDYFFQDTTRTMQVNVHRLLEDVVPEENVFYNTSVLEFDSIPLASRVFRPEPLDEDSLHISLPFEFGENLFNAMLENDINDNQDLRDSLPGIVLLPNENDDSSILGFSRGQEDTYLRLFYNIPQEDEDDERTLDLVINPFAAEPVAFHNVSANTQGTDLEVLTDQETELPSVDSNNLTYIQPGTGFATKVNFPSLKSLYEIPGTGTILSAQLQIKPLKESVTDLTPLRDVLNIAVVDANNVITQEIRTGEGLVTGNLTGEDETFGDVLYEVPVGIFLDQKLNEIPETESALVIFNENFNQTVNRLVLQGEKNEDFRARIIITYAIYDE